MFCPNCGKEAGEGRFCPYCGSQIRSVSEAVRVEGDPGSTHLECTGNQEDATVKDLKKAAVKQRLNAKYILETLAAAFLCYEIPILVIPILLIYLWQEGKIGNRRKK